MAYKSNAKVKCSAKKTEVLNHGLLRAQNLAILGLVLHGRYVCKVLQRAQDFAILGWIIKQFGGTIYVCFCVLANVNC